MDDIQEQNSVGPQHWRWPESITQFPPDYLPGEQRLARELIWRRGFQNALAARLFLYPHEFTLPEPAAYPGLVHAANRVELAIGTGERICVWGDFDADGQTATALLVEALKSIGAEAVYYIPSRIKDGHGLHVEGLRAQADAGCTLVITCDCGTNDVSQIAAAHELGIEVVVTDHHQQSFPEPSASALWNSSAAGPGDILYGLCGVATAFLLARELFSRRGERAAAHRWLDLVALGTVADLAPHSLANRALLARGLPRLWLSPRPGIRALLAVAGEAPSDRFDTTKISYKLSPMLNAAGRMGDASVGVELLLAQDLERAAALADKLNSLNQERQRLAEKLEREIDLMTGVQSPDSRALMVVGDNWHSGLLGSAATRYSARLGKTAVVISRYGAGTLARGSVRGYGDQNVLDVLAAHAHLLQAYGGHPAAAGFSLELENIEALLQGLNSVWSAAGHDGGFALAIDAIVPWEDVDPLATGLAALAAILRRLAPFSQGNPEPVIVSKELTFVSRRTFGKLDAHADLVFADRTGNMRAVRWWRHNPDWQASGAFDVAYTLSEDTWRGIARPRLTLVALRPSTYLTEK